MLRFAQQASLADRLAESRQQIDEIDRQIVELINKRATVVEKIGTIKLAAGVPVAAQPGEAGSRPCRRDRRCRTVPGQQAQGDLFSFVNSKARLGGRAARLQKVTQQLSRSGSLGAVASVRFHWPEYLMEAAELASYMFAICAVTTVFQHPASPIRQFIGAGILRRILTGLVMGLTAIAIVMSPWGRQSGAHFNPAVTFTFYRLGKVQQWDAAFYVAAQFAGAIGGVALANCLLRGAPASVSVHYAVTAPGVYGALVAFLAEFTISFSSMTAVLYMTNHERIARFTPYFAGALVATYITFEAPLSGMSMNPARTFGSALYASYWHALWIYFLAPALGMLIAAEVFLRVRKGIPPRCAKLYHTCDKRCIFVCGYGANPQHSSL